MTTPIEAVVDALGWALLHSTWQLSILAGLLWLACAWATVQAPPRGTPSVWARSLPRRSALRPPHGCAGTVQLPEHRLSRSSPCRTGWPGRLSQTGTHRWMRGARPRVPARSGCREWCRCGFWACSALGPASSVDSCTCALCSAGAAPRLGNVQARVRVLARSLGMEQAVAVVESFEVAVPMVVGILRPVILLPSSTHAGLRPDELEAVLLHELAHIRRRDLWVGFVQGLVEVVLFFHPAVWWISRRLRAERELCCDDAVLAGGMSARLYAGALLRLSEQRLFGAHSAASPMAASASVSSVSSVHPDRRSGVFVDWPQHSSSVVWGSPRYSRRWPPTMRSLQTCRHPRPMWWSM